MYEVFLIKPEAWGPKAVSRRGVNVNHPKGGTQGVGHLVDLDEPCLGSNNLKTMNHSATAIKKSALAICALAVICKKNSLLILFYIFFKFYC